MPRKKRNIDSHVPAIVKDRKSGNQYSKGRLLGTGGFAKCFVFTEMFGSGRSLAGKVVAKSSLTKSRAKQKLIAEIKIHRSLRHRFIVQFIHFFEDKRNVYIILELCEHRSLMDLVKRRKSLTVPEVRYFMAQMLDALRYMHGKNVIHRDMKLGNLFLTRRMEVRVGDFGLAAQLTSPDEKKKTICGTPNYIAPEILDNRSGGHSFEVDVWSLGVIMYTMLVGRPPFETKDVKSTYKRIRANAYSFPVGSAISEHAASLIRWILHTQPERRPTLQQIRGHIFFTRHGTHIPRALPESALRTAPAPGELLFRGSDGDDGPTAKKPLSGLSSSAVHHPASRQSMPSGASTSAAPNVTTATDPPAGTTRFAAPQKSSATASKMPPPQRKNGPESTTDSWHPCAADERAQSNSRPTTLAGDGASPTKGAAQPPRLPFVQEPDGGIVQCDSVKTAPAQTLGKENRLSRERGADDLSAAQQRYAVPCSAHGSATELRSKNGAMCQQLRERGADACREASAEPGRVTPTRCPILQTMHRKIQMSFALARDERVGGTRRSGLSSPPSAAVRTDATPKTWVVRWVDYTSKYGMGYLLNSGSIGVYFNDSTKIVLAPVGNAVEYITRSPLLTPSERGRATDPPEQPRQKHTMSQYPQNLHKKITLLRHFRNYLTEQQQKHAAKTPRELASATLYGDRTSELAARELVFVKKWVRTRHAIFFRLSNRTVQVAFFDRTELLLSSGARIITYLDKTGKRITCPLMEVINNPRPDIAKRLKYTKDILHQLICGLRK